MLIKKSLHSRISDVDLKNLSFGSELSDHMFYCAYRQGCWQRPKIKPLEPLTLSPAASVFHYGQAVFEGMKAYKDENGDVFLFRPQENIRRLNRSAERLNMPSFSEEIFLEGLSKLVDLDRHWVPQGYGQALYIRPFMIANEAKILASSSREFLLMIICTPVNTYYSQSLRIKIEQEYSRATQGGVGFTKAAGNYAAAFYPTRLANEQSYDQVLWTNSPTHDRIEESGTMNAFFRIGNQLITPVISDKILGGITRKSLIELASHDGIEVQERELTVAELVENLKKGMVKEAFGTGTAVVVCPYKIIGYQGKDFSLPQISDDKSFGLRLKSRLMEIQYNRSEDFFGWRKLVKSSFTVG
ncbi:branched-chain amino acid aminotransferase [Bacteroidetes bacterium endosymbiont of Geopemphigus sp.]|uniref:branched-chain amino acid aminotransferase n=1 Tax=Bacteroidetes bacterium endosymbiont of Geopemphigus sp. TaxID=2047937 RepID=UPI000CD32E3B|nr:branched-chain amino acid aminotransferase [Bacteroidetes bacterium endosymbiont of Geopemphigus sp.]